MIPALTGALCTPALGGLFAGKFLSTAGREMPSKTAVFQGPSKVLNENPDDFATYLAKRQAGAGAPVPVDPSQAAAPAAAAPAAAAAAPSNAGPPSKVLNDNVDPFPVYLAKRKAVEAGQPESAYESFM
mmetsp:Transcript_48706/g.111024  ORF Transcript_48706/g.111024 Transcript_48706/m.111024 type:complete len:129 (+) Transcript_48706:1-387(+)